MNRLRSLVITFSILFALASLFASTQAATAAELGAVIDTRYPDPNGPRVLAVTPGGTAHAVGLQVGDRLLEINGISLRDTSDLANRLSLALLETTDQLQLEVQRGDESISLSGAIQPAVPLPIGCGFVSDNDPTPLVSEGIHPVEITSIDGNSTPLTVQNRHRLAAGEHVLVVNEKIAGNHFSGRQVRLREQMKQRILARAYKAIVITVEPDTRYSVGARLIRESMDNEGMRTNAYWEPVLFKQRAEVCN